MLSYILEDRIDIGSGISVDGLDISDGRKASQDDSPILFDTSYDCGWVVKGNAASHTGCCWIAGGPFNSM